MKKILLSLVLALIIVSEADAKVFWNFFVPIDLFATPPPSPNVVVVHQQPQPPATFPNTVSTIIGQVINATSGFVVIQNSAGKIFTFTFYSASNNLLGRTAQTGDVVEIVPVAGTDIVQWIRFAPAAQSGGDNNIESRLLKLKSLREKNLINDEEYKETRKKILNDF